MSLGAARVQYLMDDVIVYLRKLSMDMEDLVSLALGDPDFSTPLHIRDAAKKAVDEGFTHYTHSAGLPELREAISEKLSRENGIEASPDEIIVTAGGEEAMHVTVQALIDIKDEVLIPDPCYHFDKIVRLAGGSPVSVPLKEENKFEINPEDIESRITPRTKMLVLISPNNPTGSMISKNTLDEIGKIVKKHDLLMISDECYEKIVFDGRKHYSIGSLPNMKEQVITINSFSKTYAMTGWRIGYLAADKSIANVIQKAHYYSLICVNAMAQKAALAALTGPQNPVKSMVEEYSRRRNLMINGLNSIGGIKCIKTAGSFWAFPNVKAFGMSSLNFSKYLLTNAKVAVFPGSAFGMAGEGYLRFSFSYPQETIKEALGRIRDALEKLPLKT
ncbi:MAG: aminotransferase class I/II-fold pyridoxal phosphate-dependent enzyme [Nitrososphaeria archaeon]|nr:aminotransferase class I/II-fold pyridoxal phosphate-dependent enzyme [Nitrososphaeria archaeon]NIQ32328.1 aminotransferase class I/II-fold pyridoxal phosphate-dependent enzyme [Nitrososphaeria archaeon]